MRSSLSRQVLYLGVLFALSACAARHAVTRVDIANHLDQRLGARVPSTLPTSFEVPADVELADGLSMQEAVSVGLWNNPDLAVRLAELGLARADLLTAGKLANPTVTGLIPIDPRQWQFALQLPIESLWIRPARVAGARTRGESTGQQVVQAALDLTREVRLAYVQSVAARARLPMLQTLTSLRAERRRLLALRVEVGDASPIILDVAFQEEFDAESAAQRGGLEERRSGASLSQLTYMRELDAVDLSPLGTLLPDQDLPSLDTLTRRAATSRPDLRAARLDLEATEHELRSAKAASIAASIGLQAQGGGASNNGVGLTPGISVPLFDRNQDGVARAKAMGAMAEASLKARRAQVDNEVRVAHAELQDAWQSWTRMRDKALPAQRAATRRIASAHASGDLSGVEEVDARLRLAAMRLLEVDAQQAVVSAGIRLERTLGGPPTGPLTDTSTSLHARSRR